MKKLIFIFSIFFTNLIFTNNKIVYLISPPRSSSVAFLRMMQARNDFKILHEPSQFAFNLTFNHIDLTRQWFRKDAPQTFAQVKEKIFDAAKTSNVFVKEVSFAVRNFLINDKEFVQNPNIHFVFLLRNPHHAVISFYKRCIVVDDKLAYIVGYKACYEIFEFVQKNNKNKPIIVLSEDLYMQPKSTVETLCKKLGIEFKEDALEWSNLGENFDGSEQWSEIKNKELIQHWHGDAIKSTKFAKPCDYKTDQNGKPTFEEIKDQEHLKICKQAYEENLAYYKLFLQEIKN